MADQEQKPKKDDLDDEELKKEEELLKKKEEEEREARRQRVLKRREELAKRDEERRKAVPTNDDLDTVETPKKTEGPKPKIREDVVQSGVAFLNHPKVKQAPLAQKMSFFQKKGLTPEEIQEALTRAGISQTATNASPQIQQSLIPSAPQTVTPQPQYPQSSPYQQPAYPYPPPPPPGSYAGPIVPAPKPAWYYSGMGLALTAVSCISIGFGVAYLTKKFISPLLFKNEEEIVKRQAEEKKREEEERKQTNKVIEDLTSALKSMRDDNLELKDLLKKYVDQIDTKSQKDSKALSKLTSKVSEIDSEVKKVRSMAVDSKAFQAPPAPWTPPVKSSLPSWQTKTMSTPSTSSVPPTEINNASNSSEAPKAPKEKEAENGATNGGMGDAPKPSGMNKIMNMLANGQVPDDVKEIDDAPQAFTEPNAETTVSQSRPKPWERKKEEVKAPETTLRTA